MAELAYTLENGQEQSLKFDATVSDSHESTATITEHPVEEGAAISDHIRPDLDRVSLQVVVSNKPITAPTDHNDGVSGTNQAVELGSSRGESPIRAQVLVFDGALTRVRSVYEELLDLKNRAVPVRVLTSLREYEDMAIARVSPIREAVSGNSLVATVDFKQVLVVSSEIVAAPEPREPRGNPNEEKGRENTTDGGARQSFLRRQISNLTGFAGGG